MKNLFKKIALALQWVVAATFCVAYNLLALGGQNTVPLALGVVAEGQDDLVATNKEILGSLGKLNERLKKLDEVEKTVAKSSADYDAVTKLVGEVKAEMDNVRRAQLAVKQSRVARLHTPGAPAQVSAECARQLGAIVLLAGARQEKLSGKALDFAAGQFKDITGVEFKAALTSSDIPLPTEWQGEVVELVGLYGSARQYGTVFPLGAGTVKLPRLGTDTTFGLIAGSGTVTEKSPTVVFVTFTAEKFGGLVRFPTEIDDDSVVALGQFLARYGARQIARAEDHNFWAGTGAGSGVNGTAEGLTKSVVTDSKTVALATGDLAISDVTLTKIRELRTKPDAAALRMGAYYCHPSLEQKFASLNTSGDKPYQANGLNGATLDGFPIRWVDVMPVYSTSDAASTVFMLFGDVSFNYLGVRGGIRYDTSREAGFTTDEILVRVLERFTIGKMAAGSVAGLITAAS